MAYRYCMGLRFSRHLKIIPGIRLNLSKSGVSTSVGRRGAWITFGPKDTRSTIGLPGTGLSYTESRRSSTGSAVVIIVLLIAFTAFLLF